jgi:hypothetical protein
MELEILAVKAFADYELFKKNSNIEKQLEQESLRVSSLDLELKGYSTSADSFNGATSEQLAHGFADEMMTRSESARASLESARLSYQLIEEKYQNNLRYQEEYNTRHSQDGNAHNFAQRMRQVIRLLAEDFAEAQAKALAISTGFEMVFGEQLPSPETASDSLIDEIAVWAKSVMRKMESLSQSEVEYEIVVPLSQSWRGNSMRPLVEPAELEKIINSESRIKKITFSMDEVFFNQEHVRLRNVGLSFGNRSDALVNGIRTSDFSVNFALRATIYTPEVTSPSDNKSKYHRPPIILGNVPNFAQASVLARETSLACFNINPVGIWTILLEAAAAWDNSGRMRIEDKLGVPRSIRDLKLHLRVVGRPLGSLVSAFSQGEAT